MFLSILYWLPKKYIRVVGNLLQSQTRVRNIFCKLFSVHFMVSQIQNFQFQNQFVAIFVKIIFLRVRKIRDLWLGIQNSWNSVLNEYFKRKYGIYVLTMWKIWVVRSLSFPLRILIVHHLLQDEWICQMLFEQWALFQLRNIHKWRPTIIDDFRPTYLLILYPVTSDFFVVILNLLWKRTLLCI